MTRAKQNQRKNKNNQSNSVNINETTIDNRPQYKQMINSNYKFNLFYKAIGFLDKNEWNDFENVLKLPLPACFHMNPDFAFSSVLKKQLFDIINKIGNIVIDDKKINPITLLQWYPKECGYKLGVDRRQIRRLPELEDLHQWLVKHTDNGNITRQEAVSMIPPLVLDVQPHHKCLDMCAAPGSKTSQILEIINRSSMLPPDQQGVVVANDSDTSRAYMLVHQCRRTYSSQLLITTHKGQQFPALWNENINSFNGYFDRVLCDVPCSGDGTLRKNPMIWGKWSIYSGLSLHPLQLLIAKRGIQLLKVGGIMVYSTCSMNSYENEAVVAEILRSGNGSLELVDHRNLIPQFKSRPGLSTWYVLDDSELINKERFARLDEKKQNKRQRKEFSENIPETQSTNPSTDLNNESLIEGNQIVIDSKESSQSVSERNVNVTNDPSENNVDMNNISDPYLIDCIKAGITYYPDVSTVPSNKISKVRKSVFPPTPEEKELYHLDRCLRCVPHDEDTGGFFVAVIKKVCERLKPSTISNVEPKKLSTEIVEVNNNVISILPEVNNGENELEDDVEAEAEAEALAVEENGNEESNNNDGGNRKRDNSNKPIAKGLSEFKPLDKEIFQKIKTTYHLSDDFDENSLYIREEFISSNSKKGSVKIVDGDKQQFKTIYYLSLPVRMILEADKEQRLKIVAAGSKVFERKINNNNIVEYRLLQEGIHLMAPYITTRHIHISIQDYCNLLDAGLVSYQTLSDNTIKLLNSQPDGVIILSYTYDPNDVIDSSKLIDISTISPSELMRFHVIGWKGYSRSINIMCGKVEIEGMKHKLEALGLLRPKILAPKKELVNSSSKDQTSINTLSSNLKLERDDKMELEIESKEENEDYIKDNDEDDNDNNEIDRKDDDNDNY